MDQMILNCEIYLIYFCKYFCCYISQLLIQKTPKSLGQTQDLQVRLFRDR